MSTPLLSQEAIAALMNTGTSRQGSRVYCSDPDVWAELRKACLIGNGGGLTRAGVIVRERRVNELLDDVFPLYR